MTRIRRTTIDAVRLLRSGALGQQTVANATATAITWDTEVVDAAGYFPGSGSVITIPRTGWYRVNARVLSYAATSSSGDRHLELVRSGTTIGTDHQAGVAARDIGNQLNELVYCIAGQTLSVVLYSTAGESVTVRSESQYNGGCIFQVERVGRREA